jgi:hypothetical protein
MRGTVLTKAMATELGKRVAGTDTDRQFISSAYLSDCILNPPQYWWYNGTQFVKTEYPMAGKSEVHMIWGSGASWAGSANKANAKFEAI